MTIKGRLQKRHRHRRSEKAPNEAKFPSGVTLCGTRGNTHEKLNGAAETKPNLHGFFIIVKLGKADDCLGE